MLKEFRMSFRTNKANQFQTKRNQQNENYVKLQANDKLISEQTETNIMKMAEFV